MNIKYGLNRLKLEIPLNTRCMAPDEWITINWEKAACTFYTKKEKENVTWCGLFFFVVKKKETKTLRRRSRKINSHIVSASLVEPVSHGQHKFARVRDLTTGESVSLLIALLFFHLIYILDIWSLVRLWIILRFLSLSSTMFALQRNSNMQFAFRTIVAAHIISKSHTSRNICINNKISTMIRTIWAP